MKKMNRFSCCHGQLQKKNTRRYFSQMPTVHFPADPGGGGGRVYGEVQVNKFEDAWGGQGLRLGPEDSCMVSTVW